MLYVVGIRHEAKQECYYEAYTNVDDAVKRASDYHNDTNIVVSVEEYFSASELLELDATRKKEQTIHTIDTLKDIQAHIQTIINGTRNATIHS